MGARVWSAQTSARLQSVQSCASERVRPKRLRLSYAAAVRAREDAAQAANDERWSRIERSVAEVKR